jgi:hypothetical protein
VVRGESIANYDGRISRRRGDNVRVKVKNVGCCGLVSLIVNPEIDSLAPRFERGVRVPLLNLSQTPANLRPLVVNVPPDELPGWVKGLERSVVCRQGSIENFGGAGARIDLPRH